MKTNDYSLTQTVLPTSEPITLAQAKKQVDLPIDETAHDEQLLLLIQAAREQVEMDASASYVTSTWTQVYDGFRSEFSLEKKPIVAVSSIQYYDTTETLRTLATTAYDLDKANRRVGRKNAQTWPAVAPRWDAVTITYVTGTDLPVSVPALARQAMLLLIGEWFENRGDMSLRPSSYEPLMNRLQRGSYP